MLGACACACCGKKNRSGGREKKVIEPLPGGKPASNGLDVSALTEFWQTQVCSTRQAEMPAPHQGRKFDALASLLLACLHRRPVGRDDRLRADAAILPARGRRPVALYREGDGCRASRPERRYAARRRAIEASVVRATS